MAEEALPRSVNDAEVEIIRRTFLDNEALLKNIRALFFGMDVADADKEIIKTTFQSPELMAIMWKKFCPSLDRNISIGQVQDVWMDVEKMVFGMSRDTIEQAVKYKERAIEMTKKALGLLVDPSGAGVDLSYSVNDEDPLQIALLARNQFIRHIETQLLFLKTIAELPVITPEDVAKKAALDSTK